MSTGSASKRSHYKVRYRYTMATKKAQPKSPKTLADKAVAFMQEDAKLLEKHGLARRLVITFPHSMRVPLLGRLGVALLKRSRAVLDTEFGEVTK